MYFHLVSLTLNISLANVSSGFWHLPWWNETHTVIPFLGWEILCFKQHCGSCLGSLELEGHIGLHLQPMASHLSSQSFSFFISKKDRNYSLTRLLWGFLLLFGASVVSDSLQPHGLQHTRPPCPSPTPGVHPNPCPLSRWCHPTILSCVIPFSSCLQSFPASESFQMSQFFTSGCQSIGSSASA